MEQLIQRHNSMVARTPVQFRRYMYNKIDWSNRMIGLTGPRGVGKTTLVLQRIKQHLQGEKVLYVNMEDFYFTTHRLVDFAGQLSKHGYKYLFADEIHRYPDWSKELKLIYDYYPDLYVVFTGSSVLDIRKGVSDWSRRAVMYHMQGLSFREYLEYAHGIVVPVHSLEQILQQNAEVGAIEHPLAYFAEYLHNGYYPFASESGYIEKLKQIVSMSVDADIPAFAMMSYAVAYKLKRLLLIIAESVPFKPNMSKIGEMVGVSRNVVAEHLTLLEEAGLVAQLRDDTVGIRQLGKVDKVYLDNTNIIYALAPQNANIGNVRETFFNNQARVVADVVASRQTDFCIGGASFEIGGRKKGNAQIEGLQNAYVVKDDIEYGHDNVLPLWWFGLLY